MSGEIFIETSDFGSFGLSLAEHLYLVFRDSNGDEYVLRAGAENRFWPFGDMKIEVNVPIAESADDRDGDSPGDRSSTPLDFPGLSDDAAWAFMVKYARVIEAEDYPYALLQENSNAFVGALLHAAGGTPEGMLPSGMDGNDFIGFASWDTIVDDVAPPLDDVFYGTSGADLMTGMQIDETIALLGGNDVVDAGRGNDTVLAGSGRDTVRGGAGDDRLIGGSGNDRLIGEDGDDRLIGGTGNDILRGGNGADLFVFTDTVAGETDRVTDFDVARDMLKIAGVAGLEDLTVEDRLENGEAYAALAWQGFQIRLDGVSAAELTADTFDFV